MLCAFSVHDKLYAFSVHALLHRVVTNNWSCEVVGRCVGLHRVDGLIGLTCWLHMQLENVSDCFHEMEVAASVSFMNESVSSISYITVVAVITLPNVGKYSRYM